MAAPTLPSQQAYTDAAPSWLDFALRLAFFTVAPFGVAFLSALFPLAGAVIGVAVAIVFFVLAPSLRPLIVRRPWLMFVLGPQLRFDTYYRSRPPRPFVYYLFYPLLFPYWLFNREARRELFAFKGFTVVSALVLAGTSAYQYLFKWRPELGAEPFLETMALVLLIETVVVFAALMPIATTVVRYHVTASHRRLAVLLSVGAVSVAVAIVGFVEKRSEIVAVPTARRMYLRSQAEPARSRAAREAALRAAVERLVLSAGPASPELFKDPGHVVDVRGKPLDVAREALTRFYKRDEALCFHLVEMFAADRTRVVVLYGDDGRSRAYPPIWLGYRAKGDAIFDDRAQLPKHALGLLEREARR